MRLLGLVFLVLFAACQSKEKLNLQPVSLPPPPPKVRPFEIHGHQGAPARFPENTLAGFEAALAGGADVLETNVAITRDGFIVLNRELYIDPNNCHLPAGERAFPPSTLTMTVQKPVRLKKNRLRKSVRSIGKSNLPRPTIETITKKVVLAGPLIHDLTLEEVKKFECGTKQNRSFPLQEVVSGERILSLEDLFSLLEGSAHPQAKKIRLSLNLQLNLPVPSEVGDAGTLINRVFDVIQRHSFLKRTIIESSDPELLAEARKREPLVAVSLLIGSEVGNTLQIAKALHANFLSVDYPVLDEAGIRAIHEAGSLVLARVVNRPDEWARLIYLGIDGMVTDDPRGLTNFLR